MVEYNRMEVTAAQQDKLKRVADEYGIELVLLHGSTAKGRQSVLSDMDIGVWLSDSRQGKGRQFFDLMQKMQKIFPKREVDMVVLNQADPLLLKNIATNFQLLYGTPKQAREFYLYAISRYQDYKPYLQKEAGYVDKALNIYQ